MLRKPRREFGDKKKKKILLVDNFHSWSFLREVILIELTLITLLSRSYVSRICLLIFAMKILHMVYFWHVCQDANLSFDCMDVICK